MIARLRAWWTGRHQCPWDADDMLSHMAAEAQGLSRLDRPQRRRVMRRLLNGVRP